MTSCYYLRNRHDQLSLSAFVRFLLKKLLACFTTFQGHGVIIDALDVLRSVCEHNEWRVIKT